MPAPSLLRPVVLPENPRVSAALTSVRDLPVAALMFNALCNASWLLVIDPVAVSNCWNAGRNSSSNTPYNPCRLAMYCSTPGAENAKPVLRNCTSSDLAAFSSAANAVIAFLL